MAIEFENTTGQTPEYAAFIEKFKPKKTTDDCYTPANIYAAVLEWATDKYGLQGRKVMRPFYPGGDYQNEVYEAGCVVIDNPPFSILSQICRWYDARGISYFLFAPSLTLFSTAAGSANYIICGCSITYANGATVATSFVTNLGEDKIAIEPSLISAIKVANDENTRSSVELPKYEYPNEVITASRMAKVAARGVELHIKKKDAAFVRALDAQKAEKKAIYGGGFLLSEKAAAEKAAAEKAAAVTYQLSERERAVLAALCEKNGVYQ